MLVSSMRRRRSLLIDPATLNLGVWLHAADLVPATFPAAAVWAGRPSAGASGLRRIMRKATATRNLVATTLSGGVSVVRAQGVTKSDHAAFHIAATATPSTPLAQTSVMSAAGGSFSITIASAAGITDALGTGYANPAPWSWSFSSPGSSLYATNLERTLTGYRLYTTRNTPTYYYATANVATGTGLVLVQGQITESSRVMRMRIGKGAWQSVTVPADGVATLLKATPFLVAGVINEPTWGEAPDLYMREILFSPSQWDDATFDALAERAAALDGVTL